MRRNQSTTIDGQYRLPASSGGFVVASLLLVIMLAMNEPLLGQCQEQLTVESRQQKDNEELSNTIKYLEYLSEMSRPR